MKRKICMLAIAMVCLASFATAKTQNEESVQGWVTSSLPQGVTFQSATPAQLAAAVKIAIQQHPKKAQAIVVLVFSQFSAADKAKAAAVTKAVVDASSPCEEADLVKVGIRNLNKAVDPQTGQSAQTALASVVTQTALAADSSLSAAAVAVNGVAVSTSSNSAAGNNGLSSLLQGPGSSTNPANVANTSGQVASPQ